MNKTHYFAIFIFVGLALLASFWVPRVLEENGVLGISPSSLATVAINGDMFAVEIADTLRVRAQGLSGRDGLAPSAGMLFVFENAGLYAFWMKDMRFPIDIIWIGEDMTVVGIEENASPDSYPQIFTPEFPVRYVLEVAGGIAKKRGITTGDRATLVTYKP
ncbi:MAG: hypothetical protein BMS9Abin13_257 [Patescibacteria group bacterium]|nr:MAG: hypothetical protein BMS9Abin13_257 [Patescibacteria group bacterium]